MSASQFKERGEKVQWVWISQSLPEKQTNRMEVYRKKYIVKLSLKQLQRLASSNLRSRQAGLRPRRLMMQSQSKDQQAGDPGDLRVHTWSENSLWENSLLLGGGQIFCSIQSFN